MEPLYDKYLSYTPYQYVRLNPILFIDLDGKIDVPEKYKELYPKLYSYLKNKFEKNVTKDEKIMNALIETTGLTEEQIQIGLKFGQGPKLEIKELGKNNWGMKILGHYEKSSETIQIDENYVNELENSKGDELKVYIFLVQTIILHEGAHGGAEQTGPPYSYGETGNRFEKSAFGCLVDCYNLAVTVLNNRNIEAGNAKRYKMKEGGD
jgi:hypothetical protein